MSGRLEAVRGAIAEKGVDAAFITHPADVRWTTGFTGSNALLVVTATDAHLVTDGRYGDQARREASDVAVHAPGYDLVGHVASADLLDGASRVAFDGARVTIDQLDTYREALPGVEFIASGGIVRELRTVKEEAEVQAIQAAQRLTEAVFDEILPRIGPGVQERDLAAEIVYQHLKGGAEAMAFEPIVASGPRSALPHARASARRIAVGDVVLIDMGCYVDGYASDMTRTLIVGKPEDGFRDAYAAVLEAQALAVDGLRAGISCRDADALARDVLTARGFGGYFTHGLGHGLGLEVHEAPRLSPTSDDTLPDGAVVTVEPGVYIPEHWGIRIEDLVFVRDGGCEVITRTPRDLLLL